MRNLVTGKGAFGLSPVTILPEQESGLALFSPLLLIPDINSRFLKLSPEKEKTKDREDVSLVSESTGEKTPLTFQVASSKKHGETEVILIDIALPVLESGRYAIEFSARENMTDSRSRVTRTFTIK